MMVCAYFKQKGLVFPEVQNVFTTRLFKTKQISYSDRFVELSDQKNVIDLAYLEI